MKNEAFGDQIVKTVEKRILTKKDKTILAASSLGPAIATALPLRNVINSGEIKSLKALKLFGKHKNAAASAAIYLPALAAFAGGSIAKENLIKTSNFKKLAKDSSVLRDFMAGVEPTGVVTFGNATKNKSNHNMHKAVGDAGGFIGGAAISTVLSAAGTAGIGKLLAKKNPVLGKALVTGARHAMESFRPVKTIKTLGRLGESSKLTLGISGLASKAVKGGSKLDDASKAKKLFEGSKKYLATHGVTPQEDFTKGVTMLGTLATAGLGGALNATSAHTQYNTALAIKKNKEVQEKMTKGAQVFQKLAKKKRKKWTGVAAGYTSSAAASVGALALGKSVLKDEAATKDIINKKGREFLNQEAKNLKYTIETKEVAKDSGPMIHPNLKNPGGVISGIGKGRNAEVSLAHEIGHAKAFGNKPKMKSFRLKAYAGSRGIGPLVGLGTSIAAVNMDPDSKINKYGLPAATAVAHAPLLGEELSASIKGIKLLKKSKAYTNKEIFGAVKNMGKAFGTYGLIAAGAISMPIVARHIANK